MLNFSGDANDPEWKNVPESLVESGKYNGKLYGIPTAMSLAGFFVNTDYFEEADVDTPGLPVHH